MTASQGGNANYAAATPVTQSFTVAAAPVLSIASTHAGSFTQGQNGATYTVTVGATVAATNGSLVTMTETVPSGLTLASMAGTGWTCASGGTTCTRSDVLAAGSSYPAIRVTVNVASNAGSPLVNQARVSGGGSTPASASDSTVITANPPVLSIASVHSGSFTQGQSGATYTVTVSNTANAGPTSGTVTVTETAPSGLTLVSMAGTGWTCASGGATCTRSDALAAGASYPAITVAVNVAAAAASPLVNGVTVSDGGSATASATDSTVIQPMPAVLSITKSHTGSFLQGQAGATYSVTVSNAAGAAATSGTVTVTETVPGGLALVSMAGTGWTCASGGATCTRSDALVAGASYPAITVTVNVATNAATPQVNSVGVTGGGSAGASASDSTAIVPVAALSIAKTHTGSFIQGQSGATYSLTVSNAALAGGASGTVTVTETPPSGMTLVSMVGTGWTCATGGTTCTRSDGLAAGASYPAVTVTVNVAANATSPLVNQASVSGGGSTPASASDSTVILSTLAIKTNSTLPNGDVGLAYGESLAASGGTQIYTAWAITAGTLPPGIRLESSYGVLSGTPTTAGVYAFTASVTDTAGATASAPFQVAISSAPAVVLYGGNAWFTPGSPTTADSITATVTGYVPDTCHHTPTGAVSVFGQNVTVNLTSVVSGFECGQVVLPFDLDVSIGSLAAGSYTITYNLYFGNQLVGSAAQPVVVSAAVGTMSVSGQVTLSSNPLSGVMVTLSGLSGATTTTSSGGAYSFTGLTAGGNYTVTPSLAGYAFNPQSTTFSSLSSSQTANFSASAASNILFLTSIPTGSTTPANLNAAPTTLTAPAPFSVPIGITLNSGATVTALTFGVQITPNGVAPALTGSLKFTPSASIVDSPFVNGNDTSNSLGVVWTSFTNALTAGSEVLGTVNGSIPAGAQIGQSYTITVTGVSATTGGSAQTPVPVSMGASGTITVAYTYLVGDVYPYKGDTSPNFGDGILDIRDLIQELFAVNSIPGYRPAACSDRFDAMDLYPADTGSARGGDGGLDIRDLILELFRVNNLDTARPVRASRGGVCSSSGTAGSTELDTARRGGARPAIRTAAAGAVGLGPVERQADGSERAPVYLSAAEALTRVAVTFGLGDQQSQLRFTAAAGFEPSLVQDSQLGVVAAAWLDGITVPAGDRLLLGYVTGPAGALANVQFYGVSASGLDDNREVRLEAATTAGLGR